MSDTTKQTRNAGFFEELIKGSTRPFSPKKVKTKQAEWVTIGPLQSKHILKYYNHGNRRPSKNQALKYAKDMESDNWKETGEPISFDKTGNIINGQHRLAAMILADKEYEFLVNYGLDREVFDVIDNGLIRPNSTILELEGYSDTVNLSALTRAIIAYIDNGNYDAKDFKGVNQITISEIKEYLEENPDTTNYLDRYRKSAVVSCSISSFCYWLLSSVVDKSTTEGYLDMVFMGYGLTPNTIEHYLFDKLQRNKNAAQNKMTKTAIICNVILGWRRHMGWSKSKAMQLTWDARKGFPKPTQ
jgi:hypothetical protein